MTYDTKKDHGALASPIRRSPRQTAAGTLSESLHSYLNALRSAWRSFRGCAQDWISSRHFRSMQRRRSGPPRALSLPSRPLLPLWRRTPPGSKKHRNRAAAPVMRKIKEAVAVVAVAAAAAVEEEEEGRRRSLSLRGPSSFLCSCKSCKG